MARWGWLFFCLLCLASIILCALQDDWVSAVASIVGFLLGFATLAIAIEIEKEKQK